MTLTLEDLAKIEARVNAATEGEWHEIHTLRHWFVGIPSGKGHIAISRVYRGAQSEQDQAETNAAFIANAHQDIPALIAALKQAWADNERLRDALKPFADAAPYFEPEENDGKVFDDDEMIADVFECGDLRRAAKLVSQN